MFGGWIDAVCGSMSPIIYWAISAVCTFFFFFFYQNVEICPSPSVSLCPQAVINYRHVSSAQTPPSLPPLCDTGHIIILTSNTKMPLQSLCWRNFSCCLLSAASIRHLCGGDLHWMHKITKKIHTCDECAGALCSLWGGREDENMWGFSGSWLTTWSCFRVFVLWEILLSNKKIQPNLLENSSVNMSKVTQIVSTDYREDTSVSGCGPRKLLILDVLCYESVCCWISAVPVCICLPGCGPDKETESRAQDEVVQMTVRAAWLRRRFWLCFSHPSQELLIAQPQAAAATNNTRWRCLFPVSSLASCAHLILMKRSFTLKFRYWYSFAIKHPHNITW